MKKMLPIVILVINVSVVDAQVVRYRVPRQDISREQMDLIMSSLSLPDEQESTFWSLYADFQNELKAEDDCPSVTAKSSGQTFQLERNFNDELNCIKQSLDNRHYRVELKRKYFEKIKAAMNGTVALQFLQTEALIGLVQTSRMYEKLGLNRSQWNPGAIRDETMKSQLIESYLEILPSDSARFRTIYQDYEFYYSRIVGHQLFFFEQYVDNVTSYTPGQCYKLGRDFLNMEQQEIDIRKRYFKRMTSEFDGLLASRFLALEDYFGVLSKLTAWSDSIVTYEN